MSGRLQLIEQKLTAIDGAAFQNLCDVYLALKEQEVISFNRTGSQLGKRKTVAGTPDTFYRLKDGSVRYIEYTTKADGLVAKLKSDINSCLDFKKTGIPVNEIQKIVLCFNSRLSTKDEIVVVKYAQTKKIRIELIGIDWIALEIYSKYLILAKDILGIPLDTGQLLPLTSFINEYDNKAGKLSTPLKNDFLHRGDELKDISSKLDANDLVILSGAPGVGKTKLSLEVIKEFIAKNDDYKAIALAKKDVDISEDLRIHLQSDKNYILLVDDANRQLVNFKQLLGVFKEESKGKIKLLITVRDYALNDVLSECHEFDPIQVILKKFTDEEITELVSSKSFDIKNPKYQKRIVELADGNARLAVMAARLAKEKQEEFLLGDVSDLYDTYFQTFIKDFDLFNNKALYKTLGLISFFFTIDRTDKAFIESLLSNFDLDYHEFHESIDELHKRELIEVQFNVARISEQVMSTYFFYKSFIKDEILPFKKLLFEYFQSWKSRFTDTIIPSNNTFGYEKVFDKINGSLDDFLNSIRNNEEITLEFFSVFWFYKRDELLSYFHHQIKKIPEPENTKYSTDYETNEFVYDRDKTLDFLSDLFSHPTESFIPALELSFEYCRKKNSALAELVRRIKEKVLFDETDERTGFIRQVNLFNLIIEKLRNEEPHYRETYFALANTFLSHHFQITKGGRNHSISIYQYPLPFYEVTKTFRKNIWEALFEQYDSHPVSVLKVLKNFRPGFRDANPEILEFDLSFLLPFIENRLDKTAFENIHFVNELVSWLNREKISDRSYQKLKSVFISKEYEYFIKLDWDRLRGKESYDFDNYEEFERLKEQDIRSSFVFTNESEFVQLNNAIKKTLSVNDRGSWGINKSIDIIIEENFIRNNRIGFKLLEYILENNNVEIHTTYKAIRVICGKSAKWALELWRLLKSLNNDQKIYWTLTFFDYLPEDYCNYFYKVELIDSIKSLSSGCHLQFENYEKFIPIKSNKIIDKLKYNLSNWPLIGKFIKLKNENIVEVILSIATKKIEEANYRISFSSSFFEKYSEMLSHNQELLFESYIQQERVNNHFDSNRAGLQNLMTIDNSFLLRYLKEFYGDKNWSNRNTHNSLSFIWDLDIPQAIIEDSVILITEQNPYIGIGDHSLNILFSNLSDSQKIKAKEFIFDYISKYNAERQKINTLFDAIRHVFNEIFEEAFLHFLSSNTDIDVFKEIDWVGNVGVVSGDVNFGELYMEKWKVILEYVEKHENQLDAIPIKTYIKQTIDYEIRHAESERKRKFINPKW
jgi:DNA polymerase III delta prime subunit